MARMIPAQEVAELLAAGDRMAEALETIDALLAVLLNDPFSIDEAMLIIDQKILIRAPINRWKRKLALIREQVQP